MRQTLRRSCAACAKSKHSCDLRTPRCSRCIKRKAQCVYANEPLTAPPAAPGREDGGSIRPLGGSGTLTGYRFGPLDPFDSYPQTRLPREHVQRLIHSCTYIFDHIVDQNLAYQYSSPQDRFPILPSRPERNVKSVSDLLVATCSGRPCTISCFAADSVS
jgi:hypothetical protein